ncbi:DUF1641 domain-containing protein [Neobacillus jeddahensis]|uniref:DUF1641 domain-containing protein n=1 Tax=Neobacillus jeddahensis TaxID=1461580 RepID=UPI00058BEC0A|nr:DUF1641 domain-containing protein [Neobacillus jeddahensis]
MAKPITMFANKQKTEEELHSEKIDHLMEYIIENADGLKQTIALLHELHESGILEAVVSLVKAKEKVAKIAVDQMVRPPVTNLINNAMAAAGALTELDPTFTKKLVNGLSTGMKNAEESVKSGEKAGVMDLFKAMKDPDINRTILFGIHLLKGMGEGLKD